MVGKSSVKGDDGLETTHWPMYIQDQTLATRVPNGRLTPYPTSLIFEKWVKTKCHLTRA